jgi:predicted NAD/FAD-binding protein
MVAGQQKIAVIGSGISGLATAYLLSRKHHVVLYEAADYLGGHTHTVDVQLEGQTCPVDTGFLVFNELTYPNFIALLAELGVESYASDMSFGVSQDSGRFEWAGTDLGSVFAQKRHLLSPTFMHMLYDIMRFNATAQSNLALSEQSGMTLGQLLSHGGYGHKFRDAYLLPMAAAIWSSAPRDILDFPASTFLRFCINHALLQVNDRPQWRTVSGGGKAYVDQIAAQLTDIRLNTPVLQVERLGNGVTVVTSSDVEYFDHVVFATHAPDTLKLLGDATSNERAILSQVRYQTNTAILHTDRTQMPKRKKVWSAWNYIGGSQLEGHRPVCVSYWLNKLQDLPFASPVILTLNPFKRPSSDQILAEFSYEHPIFDHAAIQAQQDLSLIQGKNRLWFAGAWTGYGFHEDGLKSALRVVAGFDLSPHWAKV